LAWVGKISARCNRPRVRTRSARRLPHRAGGAVRCRSLHPAGLELPGETRNCAARLAPARRRRTGPRSPASRLWCRLAARGARLRSVTVFMGGWCSRCCSFVPGTAVALDEGGRVGGTADAGGVSAWAALGLLPKSQRTSEQPALGSSRPRLRTPANAGYPSQSSSGRDSWGGYGGAWTRCGGNGWRECGEAIGTFGWGKIWE